MTRHETMNPKDEKALSALDNRVRRILPARYQECYDEVRPVSMGTAGLKYGADGKVAWDEIWGSFCDLAMAGGPPHKGTLLEACSPAEADAGRDLHRQVVNEICRGIAMAAELAANPSNVAGWVSVECFTESMAEWLVRAIVMENVSAFLDGYVVDLPAGPHFRIEKEIKNVVTVAAKTSHYWLEHMERVQHLEIGNLFLEMAVDCPLIQPALVGHGFDPDDDRVLKQKMAQKLRQEIGLQTSDHQYAGWLGVECRGIGAAIWMMRALVASNIQSRREGTVLFLPVNPMRDPSGNLVFQSFEQIHRFAVERGVI